MLLQARRTFVYERPGKQPLSATIRGNKLNLIQRKYNWLDPFTPSVTVAYWLVLKVG